MKQKILTLLILAIFSLSCGRKSDVVELQDWNFGGTPPLMEWLRQRVDSFEKTHPGIKVVQSQKSWNMIREIRRLQRRDWP
jgi:ABC-type glycerol-3-phosphate transport system substrate-binding protein